MAGKTAQQIRATEKQAKERREALAEAKELRRLYEGSRRVPLYALQKNKPHRARKRLRVAV